MLARILDFPGSLRLSSTKRDIVIRAASGGSTKAERKKAGKSSGGPRDPPGGGILQERRPTPRHHGDPHLNHVISMRLTASERRSQRVPKQFLSINHIWDDGSFRSSVIRPQETLTAGGV